MNEIKREFYKAVGEDICFHKTDTTTCELQASGAAYAWDLLQRKGFAYIADEVGMGKTFQAFGVISSFIKQYPQGLVFVICPGYDMQKQWRDEWSVFVKQCYMTTPRWEDQNVKGDDVIKSMWTGGAVFKPVVHERLEDFAEDLIVGESRFHILRYSSFSFPIGFGKVDESVVGLNIIKDRFGAAIKALGTSEADILVMKAELGETIEDGKQKANRIFSETLGRIMSRRTQEVLVVYDEAQYLRKTYENNRTRNITALVGKIRTDAKKTYRSLFLSATPIHASPQDVVALNNYVPEGPVFPPKPIIINNASEWQKAFAQFGIRRNRSYSDREKKQLQKLVYREYRETPISLKNSPYYALVHALVQKNLAKILESGNNGGAFRLGELSSFESLHDSLLNSKEKIIRDKDSRTIDEETAKSKVLEDTSERDPKKRKEPIDSTFIQEMNRTYVKICSNDSGSYALPHAKLDAVAENLLNTCIRNGSMRKALVFVRRIATVNELIEKLRYGYQNEINRRIEEWSKIVNNSLDEYWLDKRNESKEIEITDANDPADDITLHETRGSELPYYEAIRKRNKKGKELTEYGFLYSFRKRLGEDESPLKTCLLGENPKLWELLLRGIIMEETESVQADLQSRYALSNVGNRESLALRRCILHYFRKTDFLVDMDILNRFWYDNKQNLSQKIIFCLMNKEIFGKSPVLNEYFTNWRRRLCELVKQFEILFSKVLKGKVVKDISGIFVDMDIVAGRSSKLISSAPLTQFNLPGYPNVLICTDVLKEGINLQYFCDSVIHYGVAWTSGDLEQRIGRVDRINCMYGRKIIRSRFPDSPKLLSAFPALLQTLDHLQVQKVRAKKVDHDACMGGNYVQESPKMLVSDQNEYPEQKMTVSDQFRDIVPEIGSQFFPFVYYNENRISEFSQQTKTVNSMGAIIQAAIDSPGQWKEEIDRRTLSCLEEGETVVYELQYLSQYSSFLLSNMTERSQNDTSSIVFRITKARKSKVNQTKYLLIPVGIEEQAVLPEIKQWCISAYEMCQHIPPSQDLSPIGFKFSSDTSLPYKEYEFLNILNEAGTLPRKQLVYACECNRSIVFMSYVCPVFISGSGDPNVSTLEMNKDRDFGYFVEMEACGKIGVWYVVTVSSKLRYIHNMLNEIVSHVAKTADCNQHILNGLDVDEPEPPKAQWTISYLVKGFPERSIHDFTSLLSHSQRGIIMDAKTDTQPILLSLNISRNVFKWLEDHLSKLSSNLPIRSSEEGVQSFFALDPSSSLSLGLVHYNTQVLCADNGKYRLQCTLLFQVENSNPLICWQFRGTPNTRMQSIPMIDWSEYSGYSDNKYLICGRGLLYNGEDSAGQDVMRTCILTHSLHTLDTEIEGYRLIDHFYDIINAMHTGSFRVSAYNEKISSFIGN
jgi:hypothetical protein